MEHADVEIDSEPTQSPRDLCQHWVSDGRFRGDALWILDSLLSFAGGLGVPIRRPDAEIHRSY